MPKIEYNKINTATLVQALQSAKFSLAVVMNICNQSRVPENEQHPRIDEIFKDVSIMIEELRKHIDRMEVVNAQELRDYMNNLDLDNLFPEDTQS